MSDNIFLDTYTLLYIVMQIKIFSSYSNVDVDHAQHILNYRKDWKYHIHQCCNFYDIDVYSNLIVDNCNCR